MLTKKPFLSHLQQKFGDSRQALEISRDRAVGRGRRSVRPNQDGSVVANSVQQRVRGAQTGAAKVTRRIRAHESRDSHTDIASIS